jgi:hypothetical protein
MIMNILQWTVTRTKLTQSHLNFTLYVKYCRTTFSRNHKHCLLISENAVEVVMGHTRMVWYLISMYVRDAYLLYCIVLLITYHQALRRLQQRATYPYRFLKADPPAFQNFQLLFVNRWMQARSFCPDLQP